MYFKKVAVIMLFHILKKLQIIHPTFKVGVELSTPSTPLRAPLSILNEKKKVNQSEVRQLRFPMHCYLLWVVYQILHCHWSIKYVK